MDRGVLAAAEELFGGRNYPSVVALCDDILDSEPECVPMLLLRARARVALRRDLEAQADLRDVIRLDPHCGSAYRLLGELAARRDEHDSAAIFFREALRLDPDDQQADDWLKIVDGSLQPAAAASKIPAPAVAAGHSPRAKTYVPVAAPTDRTQMAPRFARGTASPDEKVTEPYRGRHELFARGSDANGASWKTPETPVPAISRSEPAFAAPQSTLRGPIVTPRPAGAVTPRPMARGPVPELPGFGDYLVTSGILTRERLRAAQAYQRSMKVQLSTAIVTLGLATPQRIEWAAVAHQSELARANKHG